MAATTDENVPQADLNSTLPGVLNRSLNESGPLLCKPNTELDTDVSAGYCGNFKSITYQSHLQAVPVFPVTSASPLRFECEIVTDIFVRRLPIRVNSAQAILARTSLM